MDFGKGKKAKGRDINTWLKEKNESIHYIPLNKRRYDYILKYKKYLSDSHRTYVMIWFITQYITTFYEEDEKLQQDISNLEKVAKGLNGQRNIAERVCYKIRHNHLDIYECTLLDEEIKALRDRIHYLNKLYSKEYLAYTPLYDYIELVLNKENKTLEADIEDRYEAYMEDIDATTDRKNNYNHEEFYLDYNDLIIDELKKIKADLKYLERIEGYKASKLGKSVEEIKAEEQKKEKEEEKNGIDKLEEIKEEPLTVKIETEDKPIKEETLSQEKKESSPSKEKVATEKKANTKGKLTTSKKGKTSEEDKEAILRELRKTVQDIADVREKEYYKVLNTDVLDRKVGINSEYHYKKYKADIVNKDRYIIMVVTYNFRDRTETVCYWDSSNNRPKRETPYESEYFTEETIDKKLEELREGQKKRESINMLYYSIYQKIDLMKVEVYKEAHKKDN